MTVGSNRVKRGGSWNNNASNCRLANRNNNNPENSNNNIGFRLASSSVTPGGCRLMNRSLSLTPAFAGAKRIKNAALVAVSKDLHFCHNSYVKGT